MSASRHGMREEHVRRDPPWGGRLRTFVHESAILRGNPLGDPHQRELHLFEAGAVTAASPLLVLLPAYGARPAAWLETHPWRTGLVLLFAAAVERGAAPPARLALVDAFTRLGGSQYVNSSAVGRYQDWMLMELLPDLRSQLGLGSAPVALAGKSSGAYGALSLALGAPGAVQAVVAISPDGAFEHSLWPNALVAARALLAFGSDPQRFLAELEREPGLADDHHAVLDLLCMSACYAPRAEAPLGYDLPLDLTTGMRDPAVWQRFLRFDPLQRIEREADALRSLRHIHLECGLRDEYHLLWAARALSSKLRAYGVTHHYEEHPAGHRGLDARLLPALCSTARVLTG